MLSPWFFEILFNWQNIQIWKSKDANYEMVILCLHFVNLQETHKYVKVVLMLKSIFLVKIEAVIDSWWSKVEMERIRYKTEVFWQDSTRHGLGHGHVRDRVIKWSSHGWVLVFMSWRVRLCLSQFVRVTYSGSNSCLKTGSNTCIKIFGGLFWLGFHCIL